MSELLELEMRIASKAKAEKAEILMNLIGEYIKALDLKESFEQSESVQTEAD